MPLVKLPGGVESLTEPDMHSRKNATQYPMNGPMEFTTERQFVVAGFDVGQTSTTCVLVDQTGRLVAQGRGPGVIHLSAEGGPVRFTAAVGAALDDAYAAHAPVVPVAAALGATGVMDQDSPEAHMAADLTRGLLPHAHIAVVSDAETALFGAHGGGPGVIVIAGTGSIALGRDARGRQARAGGWGWLVDDGGSAFAIGRDGLQAAVRGAEGSGPETALTARMRAHFGDADLYALKRTVFAPDFGARGFAGLAAHVAAAAAAGDAVAQAIIARAADDLANLARAVARQLTHDDAHLPVACLGGAFTHITGLRDGFEAALVRQHIGLVPRTPLLPPDLGAALMALQAQGVDVAAALPQLRASVPTEP